jgi:hypothetical protein
MNSTQPSVVQVSRKASTGIAGLDEITGGSELRGADTVKSGRK